MQIAQTWRLKGQRYALKGNQCNNCGEVSFPPRAICPHCEGGKASAYEYQHSRIVALPEAGQPALRRAAR